MLIDFAVSNYRSFREQQNFSMVKTKGDEQPSNTFRIESIKGLELLKTAAIYGANASGKSNFLKALKTMKRIVTNTSQRGDKLPLIPFKLDRACLTEPTEFEITFIVQNIRYQYGFSATETQIFDEWLFAYPKGHSQKWFERVWDNEEKKHHWKFSSFLLGTKQVWQQATRDNALFLSTAVQLNSEQLKPLFDWFDKNLLFSGVDGFGPEYTAHQCNEGKKEKVIKLLKAVDFNIHNINVETEDFDPSLLPDDMPETLKNHLVEKLKDIKHLKLKTVHYDNEGSEVNFDFNDESDGTQKFFSFVGPILDVLENGYTLCIDELNVNMHPKLVQFLVELFHGPANNPKNAQLIFTTHETSILNQNIFRRDQIWFCERDNKQSSILYPLSDFSPKKGKENLEAGYLSGRYGALPFIHAFDLGR